MDPSRDSLLFGLIASPHFISAPHPYPPQLFAGRFPDAANHSSVLGVPPGLLEAAGLSLWLSRTQRLGHPAMLSTVSATGPPLLSPNLEQLCPGAAPEMPSVELPSPV